MRFPVVLLDVGETLIGPGESFGTVYARVYASLGLDLSPTILDDRIRLVWEEMTRRIPVGTDRYRHFPGGEEEFWLRFSRRVVEKASGRAPQAATARRALSKLRQAFAEPSAWIVYPDVVPALRALKNAGVRLGIVSNWDSRLPRILAMLGLSPYFDAIGVSHLVGVEKPRPELFHHVLEGLNGRAEQALHVGDTPELDLQGATAAGLTGLLVDRRARLDRSYAALADLSDLPRIARAGPWRKPASDRPPA